MLNLTDFPFSRTAGTIKHPAGRPRHAAGPPSRTADSTNHAGVRPDRMAGPASRTDKSFIRTAKPSSRAVFRPKHAENANNHPFSLPNLKHPITHHPYA